MAQVIEVAREAIHAVNDYGVAFADEAQQSIQLWALGVLARRLVDEHLAHLCLFQLPFRVLVKAADPDIADTMSLQNASEAVSVRLKSMTLASMCQKIQRQTLF
ncbi:hypothetical protein D3C76_931420 [compost metagenome]